MSMSRFRIFTVMMVASGIGFLLIGCNEDASVPGGSPEDDVVALLPEDLLLDEMPANPTPITRLKQIAKEGDEVVMRVIVGGRKKPFVENQAVMTVIDASLNNQCKLDSHGCKTPWDYCCESPEQLKANLATVQIVGDEGWPLAVNLTRALKIEPMALLVVRGKVAPRPNPSVLIVNASGLFVAHP